MRLFSALGALFDLVPGWLYAILIAAVLVQSCRLSDSLDKQKVATAQAQLATETAKREKVEMIAAAAQATTAAVTTARNQERASFVKLQGDVDDLHKKNAVARTELAAAADRLHAAITASNPFANCANVPAPSSLAAGVDDTALAKFQRAGRGLTDGILQLLSESDEVTRERNICLSNFAKPD